MAINTGATERRSRRTILAGALGAATGLLAARFGTPDSAKAASGDPLILGSLTNNSGATGTKLSTNSTDTALYVQQNGTGTALRGIANNGIAGFFTSSNGTGVSGVTAANNKFGVYGANDALTYGGGEAIRANGQQNHGVVATTANAAASAIIANSSAADGVAILATNSSAGTDTTAGSGIRALSGGGTVADIHPEGNWSDAAGEFAGPVGVIGATTAGNYGVIGLGGLAGTGVYGLSDSSNGVIGASNSGTGTFAFSNSGIGIYAQSTSFIGAQGYSTSSVGVAGQSNSDIGVLATSSTGTALHADGNATISGQLDVTGNVNKAGGTFKIDHPLDPANKFLYHSFVESPDMMNIYNGIATLDGSGEATVKLPVWFEQLNKDFRYQLTAIGKAAPDLYVKSKVKGNAFSIGGGSAGQEVSWQLTGIRQDAWANAHRVVVEEAKPKAQKGRFLHPKEHGQPESKGIGYAERKAIEAKLAKPKT